MIALAAMERIYRNYLPTEHPATFSEINLRILTYGIYLLLVVLHTAPLYGWGEYSNLRGNINIELLMKSASSIQPEQLNPRNSFVLTIGASPNITCEPDNSTVALKFQPGNIANVLSLLIPSVYGCDLRIKPGMVWTLLMRFPSEHTLDMFYQEYTAGEMVRKVHTEMQTNFHSCNASYASVYFEFMLQTNKYGVYKGAHISFQDIGVCSLDYSSTNTTIISWIPFVIITSVVIPYAIVLVTGLVLRRSHFECRGTVFLSPICFIVGSVLCLSSTVPYYYINLLNYNDVPVSFEVNVTFTAIYFCHSIGFVIVSTCYGCCRGHVLPVTDISTTASISLVSLNCSETKYHRRDNGHGNNV